MACTPHPELRADLLRRRDVEQEARFAYLDARDRGEEPDWAPVRAIDQDNLAFLIDGLPATWSARTARRPAG
ncbi:MAG: hypothetical protein ACRDTE_09375 [Pseudonocardiaceae bacterium]